MRYTPPFAVVTALALVAFGATARAADDDLEVVKRATQASPQVEATPRAESRTARAGHKPTWLKVEVVDKASGRRRVSVNLPIALVEVFGDDVPVRWGCGPRRDERSRDAHCGLRLREALALLEKGQALVEIEQQTERIKVWVE